MILLQRGPLPADSEELLEKWTARVAAAGGSPGAARDHWKIAKAPKQHIHLALEPMAHGNLRCMYCDDSRATDIDHFQPIARAPQRAFDWTNHLFACSHCNSNLKRDQYPTDRHGTCQLVDPTVDDPADHLVLLLQSGEYRPAPGSPKGQPTIDVFGLNRRELVKGRLDAFVLARLTVPGWFEQVRNGDPGAARTAQALLDSPFVDVVRAMTRLKPSVAAVVVGPNAVPALDAWRSTHG